MLLIIIAWLIWIFMTLKRVRHEVDQKAGRGTSYLTTGGD